MCLYRTTITGKGRRNVRAGEESALAFDGMIQMLREWVVDYSNEWHQFVREGEGDGYVRESVDEVRRAVDRIADEGRGGGKKRRGWCWG